ncbi:MAG: hypothetical protein LBL62_07135 [Planctomycetaceae bacterium]|nr:hypothetical protein [Planctomycetaceae bacterium]
MKYTQAVLKFTKLIMEAQQREAVTQGRSLLPIPATVYYEFYGYHYKKCSGLIEYKKLKEKTPPNWTE